MEETLEQEKASPPKDLSFVADVALQVSVEFGRTAMTIRRFLELAPGAIIGLDAKEGEPVVVRVNGKQVASGEAVSVNGHYGVRITEVIDPEARSSG